MKELVVKLGLSSAGFEAGLSHAQAKLQGFLGSLPAALASPLGLAGGIGGVLGLGKAITEAQAAASAQKRLEMTLQTTGSAAGFTGDQLAEMATALQQTTNFADDATKSAMALLATFRNLRGANFADTIRTALDISAIRGESLETVVNKLGRALSSPAEGMGRALKSEGIFVADEVEQRVKKLQEAGQLEEAQRALLQELQASYGGGAEAMVSPFKQLQNELSDVSENIGTAFLPVLKEAATALTALLKTVNGGTEFWSDFSRGVKLAALDLEWVAKSFANLGVTFAQVGGQIVWFFGKLTGLRSVVDFAQENIDALQRPLNAWDASLEARYNAAQSPEFGQDSAEEMNRRLELALKEKQRAEAAIGDAQRKRLETLEKFVRDQDPLHHYTEGAKKWNAALAAGLVTLEQHRAGIERLGKDLEEKVATPFQKAIRAIDEDLRKLLVDDLDRLVQGMKPDEADAVRRRAFEREMVQAGQLRERADLERQQQLRLGADALRERNLEPGDAEAQALVVNKLAGLEELIDIGGLNPKFAGREALRLMREAAGGAFRITPNATFGSQEAYRYVAGAGVADPAQAVREQIANKLDALPKIKEAIDKLLEKTEPDKVVLRP